MSKKTCKECKSIKKISEFPLIPYTEEPRDYCKNCTKNFHKWYQIKSNYNLTKEDVESMYILQLGKCDICKQELPFENVCIDHCHDTEVVRGLLCQHCNSVLGFAKDNISTLGNAIEYLKKYPK